MTNFFPLTNLPPRKFNLGDRVEHWFGDNASEYVTEGTIFGYKYRHLIWDNKYSRTPEEFGWVCGVVWTYESGETPSEFEPYYYDDANEDELRLIERAEFPKIALTENALRAMFLNCTKPFYQILSRCKVNILGNSEGTQIISRLSKRSTNKCLVGNVLAVDFYTQRIMPNRAS